MPVCPANHPSETDDFCSVCGVELTNHSTPTAAAATVATATGEACPECTTPREHRGQVFCEVCGYNYRTGTSGVPGVEAVPVAPKTTILVPPSAEPTNNGVAGRTASAPVTGSWELLIEVDPALYGGVPNPDAPVGQPTQRFPLFDSETIIGRGGTGARVHVPVHSDPGVSRRHALVLCQPDGTLSVRDLGSANGTQLNGADLVAGVDSPVHAGDRIAIGAWTRITVHPRH